VIGNGRELEEFERELAKSDKRTLQSKFDLLDAMWEEAVYFGVLPPRDILEGLQVDLRVARTVNSV